MAEGRPPPFAPLCLEAAHEGIVSATDTRDVLITHGGWLVVSPVNLESTVDQLKNSKKSTMFAVPGCYVTLNLHRTISVVSSAWCPKLPLNIFSIQNGNDLL